MSLEFREYPRTRKIHIFDSEENGFSLCKRKFSPLTVPFLVEDVEDPQICKRCIGERKPTQQGDVGP
jgi:hypothetical protein